MADVQVKRATDLDPLPDALIGTEVIPVTRPGASYKIDLDDMAAFVGVPAGVSLTSLPVWDASSSFSADEDALLIVKTATGVAYKVSPEDLIVQRNPNNFTVSGTSHTWAVGEENLLCTSGSATTITIPQFASVPPNHKRPVKVHRNGAGTVALAAGTNVTINKPSDKSAACRLQQSVIFFEFWLWLGGSLFVVAYGDLA